MTVSVKSLLHHTLGEVVYYIIHSEKLFITLLVKFITLSGLRPTTCTLSVTRPYYA